MRALRVTILAAVTCLLVVGAASGQGPAQPQTVDDVIAKVLRESAKDAASPAPASATEAVVMGARIGEHPDRTRFVVELSEPVAMRTFTLNNPNRVVIDMPAVRWHLDGPPRPSGNGAVRSYRYGMFRPGNSRFVIDLNQPVKVSDPLVLPPANGYGYRVVFDLFPTTQAKFDRTAGWPADVKARDVAAQLASLPSNPPPPQTRIKKVIVIDPGHGGPDPGTTGVDGTSEKDLVLAVGLRLERVLLARGYSVHMTRDSDVAVDLRQRVRIARSWRADLMISIHADSNPDPSVSGLSIYTLSEKGSDAEAAALVAKENSADKLIGVDLSGDNSDVAPILIDLAQRDTMNKSSHFAEIALSELRGVTDILPRQPHRSGALVVLKAPDVPAVLIELGYLSNVGDARQMQSDAWRARVARAIAAAVDRQFMTSAEASAQATQ
jgi:N-acetylmuramoyl-L-alanine amidase